MSERSSSGSAAAAEEEDDDDVLSFLALLLLLLLLVLLCRGVRAACRWNGTPSACLAPRPSLLVTPLVLLL